MISSKHLLFMVDKELTFLNAYEKSILKLVIRLPQGCRYPAKEIASQIGASRETVFRSVKNLESSKMLNVSRTKSNNWTLTVGDGLIFAFKSGIDLAKFERSEMIPQRKKAAENNHHPVVPQTTPCSPTDHTPVVPQTTHKEERKKIERTVYTEELSLLWKLLSPSPTNRFLNGSQKSQLQVDSLVENFVVIDVFPSGGVV